MPINVFDKVLKIIQIVVTLLQMAIKAFTGINDVDVPGNYTDSSSPESHS